MTAACSGDLNVFLDAVAAKKPTPGGGGVTAAMGALACAMARMVAAYSPGRNADAETVASVQSLLAQLERLDHVLRGLVDEDARAYLALTAATKCAKEDPSTAADRDAALGVAVSVPLEIAAVASESLHIMERLLPVAGRYLLSDLGVAATLAAASVRAASYMVRVNTALLEEGNSKRETDAEIDRLIGKSSKTLTRIEANLADRA